MNEHTTTKEEHIRTEFLNRWQLLFYRHVPFSFSLPSPWPWGRERKIRGGGETDSADWHGSVHFIFPSIDCTSVTIFLATLPTFVIPLIRHNDDTVNLYPPCLLVTKHEMKEHCNNLCSHETKRTYQSPTYQPTPTNPCRRWIDYDGINASGTDRPPSYFLFMQRKKTR